MDREEERIVRKYSKKLEGGVDGKESRENKDYSSDYLLFRKEALGGKIGFYEGICRLFGRILKVKSKDKNSEIAKAINAVHLRIHPADAASFASLSVLLFIFIVIIAAGLLYFLTGFDEVYLLIPLLLILISVLLIKPLSRIPVYLENKYRLKASNQMVLCIMYVVMYMRHTSNLEHAIKFASEHLDNPLALDLRKVFWDVETGRYANLKESLDSYLAGWREHSLEFVQAFNLIQGSLYEGEEARRVGLLEKALDVMLNGTYEKMMHYAQELKNPITMIHMLGVILPILGLVILPLIGSLMGGSANVKLVLLLLLYNIALPLAVYFIGAGLLARRPTGYNESNVLERNPGLVKHENILIKAFNIEIAIPAWFIAVLLFIAISGAAFLPLLIGYSGDFDFLGSRFFDYKTENGLSCSGDCYGPFGAGSVLLSLFLPLGLAISLGSYYHIKSYKFVRMRDETRKLEKEFSGGLFQLGNRVGDGVPVEIAFNEVANTMEGSASGGFFRLVAVNIMEFGMSLKEGLFGERGAIWYYPSSLVESSMKILLQASKKSSEVVAKSMVSISFYINNIHQVNERLKDLLSEILSSMKSQISFLTPVIAGIVVGISAMITTVLSRLVSLFTQTSVGGEQIGVGGLAGLLELFEIPSIIPSYYLQMIIGVYVAEIAIVLTILANGIENGRDKISERASLSKNLYMTGILYFLIAVVVTFVFTLLANSIPLTSGG